MLLRGAIRLLFIMLLFQTVCLCGQDSSALGSNYFRLGKPAADFHFFAASRQANLQRQTNYCWTACLQMLLHGYGIRVTQSELVGTVFGNLLDTPALTEDIFNNVNNCRPLVRSSRSAEFEAHEKFDMTTLTRLLSKNGPLLAEILVPEDSTRHITVLSELYYARDAYENPIVIKVVLRDPWPVGKPRKEFSWLEFVDRQPVIWSMKMLEPEATGSVSSAGDVNHN